VDEGEWAGREGGAGGQRRDGEGGAAVQGQGVGAQPPAVSWRCLSADRKAQSQRHRAVPLPGDARPRGHSGHHQPQCLW